MNSLVTAVRYKLLSSEQQEISVRAPNKNKPVARRARHEPRQGKVSKKIRSISAEICENFFAYFDAAVGHVSLAAVGFIFVRSS
jgi:hypothetical protein